MGANVTDQILPSYTTHVVTKCITPQLKQHLGLLASKSMDFATKHSRLFDSSHISAQQQTIIGHTYSIKLVTFNWLESCLLQGKRIDEAKYEPEYACTNGTLSVEDMQRFRKQQYNVKRGLFKNHTFVINEDTFEDNDDKADNIENMIRNIIENGGKVIPNGSKCHYIIQEDGYDPAIWNTLGNVDKMDRKVIHYRWVEECIKKNSILDDANCMHLLPLPQRIPVTEFETVNVALTLFEKADKDVFDRLVKLYGFGSKVKA